jgi:hypothetical protein
MPYTDTHSRAKAQPQNIQNRASRRRERAMMRALAKDAAGVFSLQVVRRSEPLPDIIAAEAILNWLNMMSNSDRGSVCLTCDQELSLEGQGCPDAFVIMIPARPDPSLTSITGVCPECAARHSDDELCGHVATQWRGRVLPIANMHPHGGRA